MRFAYCALHGLEAPGESKVSDAASMLAAIA
jgi:hypothetical protein